MSTGEADLLTLRPELDQIPEKDLLNVRFPFRHYLQATMKALKILQKHRAKLEAAGMDFAALERLPLISGAARDAYAQSIILVLPKPESRIKWEEGREEGEYLLYDLLAALEYAVQDYPEYLKQISVIRQGSTNADFVQDLMDASVLGRECRTHLEKIGYDLANIDRASELSKELSELLAEASVDNSNSPELRLSRDRCLTLLKKTIDAGISQARFIFRHDRKISSELIIEPPVKYKSKATAVPVAS